MHRAALFILLLLTSARAMAAEPVAIFVDRDAAPRVQFGVEKLTAAMADVGLKGETINGAKLQASKSVVIVGTRGKSAALKRVVHEGKLKFDEKNAAGKEGFVLKSLGDGTLVIAGTDDSGTLYGCLELADRVRKAGKLPEQLDVADAPAFALRGPCIGMQKSEMTYDNAIYDFPYTRESFPFSYDKEHWTRYLDHLIEHRMNTLYLWNGHPFTSLLKLPKYPEAQEVSDEQLKENIETFRWLTAEADRRGIWVIQFFYNIHVSHPFARHHKIPFHLKHPTPLVSEYMRYCTGEFIANYPNVGYMMCLGEALGDRYTADWLSKVIIPGVRDGMKELGTQEEPPIIVRAHAAPIEKVMPEALKVYKNIYTMQKWNQEHLTWTNIRGPWRRRHEWLAGLGSQHIVNVHLLGNLEPFRWGSPEFVQECMTNMQRMGASGLHLYPLRYWEWPVTADVADPPLKQIDRDWIWYAAWARYAWNPNRNANTERAFWIDQIAQKFGSKKAGEKILDARQAMGPCAPMLHRRTGISADANQYLSLGMRMAQLVNPDRWRVWPELYDSLGPEGETLTQWTQREFHGQPHEGETPLGVAKEVERLSAEALRLGESAREHVNKNRKEYERLVSDLRCNQALCRHYAAKIRAAVLVLRYGHSKDIADLENALPLLQESLDHYAKLVELTDGTYRDACSLQISYRSIPFRWSKSKPYKHWRECLPEYQKELDNFKRNLALLRRTAELSQAGEKPRRLPQVGFRLLSKNAETYQVEPGRKPMADRDYALRSVASELSGLTGIRFSNDQAKSKGVKLDFELAEDAKILVGFLTRQSPTDAKIPGAGWDLALINGAAVKHKRFPRIDVYARRLPKGRHTLDLGPGTYCVFGFTRQSETLAPRVVLGSGKRDGLDWLFE